MLSRRALFNFDWSILVVTLVICSIGVALIFSATYGGDHEGLHRKQLLWIAVGLGLMLLVLAVDYHFWVEFSGYFYLLSIAVLVGVLIFGKTISGAPPASTGVQKRSARATVSPSASRRSCQATKSRY